MSIVIKNVVPVGQVTHKIVWRDDDSEYSMPIIAYCEIELINEDDTIDLGQPSNLQTIYCAAFEMGGILTPLACFDDVIFVIAEINETVVWTES